MPPTPTSPATLNAPNGIVQFPQLARDIRGYNITEIQETFKALAQVAITIQNLNKEQMAKNLPPPTLAHIFQRFHKLKSDWRARRSEHGGYSHPHLLSTLNVDQVLNFVFKYVHHISGNAAQIIPRSQGVSRAESWLLRCVTGSHVLDNTLHNTLESYSESQPVYSESEFPWNHAEAQKLGAYIGGHSGFPGLDGALRLFPYEDIKGRLHVLYEFMRLGYECAHLWMHIFLEHGIRRGQPLGELEHHARTTLLATTQYYKARIEHWNDPLPVRDRQQLTQVHFSGELMFLIDYVFPTFIIPINSTIRENEFAYAIQQWIVDAATAPRNDPSGIIRAAIRNGPYDPSTASSRVWYRPAHVHAPIFNWDHTFRAQQDVELEPHGPPIEILDYVHSKRRPHVGSVCSICQEQFDRDNAESCVETDCSHLFHRTCLDAWANGLHTNDFVQCPNCRQVICPARPHRVALSSQ